MIERSRKRRCAAFALVLAGPAAMMACQATPVSPDEPPATGDPLATYRSGSRLRARVVEGSGGAARFLGWEDQKARQECQFHTAEDGERRCLPVAGQGTSIEYLDDACTVPVAVRSCGASDRYAVAEVGGPACAGEDTPYSVYEVGDRVDDAPTFGRLGGSCVPAGPASPNDELHAVKKIPVDLFVAGAIEEVPHGDRLSARVLRGDDGSREVLAIRDATLDVECDPRIDELGQVRCAPAASALGGGAFFEDPGCARPLLADIGASPDCPAPRFAEASGEGSACGGGFHAVQVGKKVSAMSVYQGEPGACGPAAFVPPDWAFYEVGAEVEAASLPALRSVESGRGRLRVAVFTGDDGAPLAQGERFIDTERNEGCIPRLFADGKTRCVPENVPRFNLYSDAGCTAFLAAIPKEDGCAAPAPRIGFVTATPADPMCPGPAVVEQLREIGAPFAGAIVYAKSGSDGCTGLDASQIHVDLYEVGAPVDSSVLAEVDEATR